MTDPLAGDREHVLAVLQEILSDVAEDLEESSVDPDRPLVELGLESISLVYLIAELQQSLGLGDLLFAKMRAEGTLLKQMTVGDIVTAIQEIAGRSAVAPVSS
jgi:aryl carrier-like protein